MKVNLLEVSVMVSGGIRKDSMSKSKVDLYRLCSLRVKADSVLCLQCGKWIHGRCTGMKIVTKVFKKCYMQKM